MNSWLEVLDFTGKTEDLEQALMLFKFPVY